jgi:hypothetical protein
VTLFIIQIRYSHTAQATTVARATAYCIIYQKDYIVGTLLQHVGKMSKRVATNNNTTMTLFQAGEN